MNKVISIKDAARQGVGRERDGARVYRLCACVLRDGSAPLRDSIMLLTPVSLDHINAPHLPPCSRHPLPFAHRSPYPGHAAGRARPVFSAGGCFQHTVSVWGLRICSPGGKVCEHPWGRAELPLLVPSGHQSGREGDKPAGFPRSRLARPAQGAAGPQNLHPGGVRGSEGPRPRSAEG